MKIAIINSVIIICFTGLAIYFNHWWIVLFSLLFLFEEKRVTKKTEDNDE